MLQRPLGRVLAQDYMRFTILDQETGSIFQGLDTVSGEGFDLVFQLMPGNKHWFDLDLFEATYLQNNLKVLRVV